MEAYEAKMDSKESEVFHKYFTKLEQLNADAEAGAVSLGNMKCPKLPPKALELKTQLDKFAASRANDGEALRKVRQLATVDWQTGGSSVGRATRVGASLKVSLLPSTSWSDGKKKNKKNNCVVWYRGVLRASETGLLLGGRLFRGNSFPGKGHLQLELAMHMQGLGFRVTLTLKPRPCSRVVAIPNILYLIFLRGFGNIQASMR